MTPAQRRAQLEAAKAMIQAVEADEANASPSTPAAPAPTKTTAPTTKAAAQAAAGAAVAAKVPAAPSTPAVTVTPPKIAASAPKPAVGDQVAAHADHKQPSVWETLQSVARRMKGQK